MCGGGRRGVRGGWGREGVEGELRVEGREGVWSGEREREGVR